jgi:hypothetical protein
MAEVDKVMEEAVVETPQTEEIDIELESENVTATSEEVAAVSDEFYKNIALDLSEDILKSISKELVDEYKKDKISRKDWETSYTNGLDLLGFRTYSND